MAVKVGVIGCGYWGPNLIRNFSQIEATDMYYICDLDEAKMDPVEKTYPTVKATKNYKDMLKDAQVDAVVIATPVASHFKLAKEALLDNKHVLIEKPMTSSVKEAEELIEIARERNRILMVDHTFEYAQAINKMKGLIESSEIGQICYIKAEWLNLGLLQPDINVIWDLGTHIYSIVSYVSGMNPISLSVNASAYVRNGVPEVAHVYVKFPKDITMYMTVSWLEPRKIRRLTVVGNKKMLVYDLMNEEEQLKIYDKGVDLEEDVKDITQFRINYRYGDIYSPNIKKIEPLRVMCTDFADSIINNKEPISNGLSGLNVVKMLEASEESLRNNGKEIMLK